MAISVVGHGSAVVHSGAGSWNTSLPAGCANNDLAFLHVGWTSTSTVPATPAGWTLLGARALGTGSLTAVYYQVLAPGFGSTVSLTGVSAGAYQSFVSVYRGVDPITPIDIATNSGTLGSSGGPNKCRCLVNATVQNTWLVSWITGQPGNAIVADAAGHPPACTMMYSQSALTFGTASAYRALSGVSDASNPNIYNGMSAPGHATNWAWIAAVLRPLAPVPTTNATLGALTALAPSRTHGVPITPVDSYQSLLSVEVATYFASPSGVWAASQSDPAGTLWASDQTDVTQNAAKWGPSLQWLDITYRVRGLQWSRGSDSPGGPPRVGVATITLDNVDGDCSPWGNNLVDGDLTRGGKSLLPPKTLMRFGCTTIQPDGSSMWHPWFCGTVERLQESNSQNVDDYVDVTLIETMADITAVNKPAQAPSGLLDTLTNRVNRLLADAGWRFNVDLADGQAAATALGDPGMQITTMTGDRMAELQATVDSVGCDCLSSGSGDLRVRPYVMDTTSMWAFSNFAADLYPPVRVAGSVTDWISTPDAPPFDVTGDIDVRIWTSLDNWASGASQTLISKFDGGPNNSWMLQVTSLGNLRLTWSTNGVATVLANSSVPVGFAPGFAAWVRATLNTTTGTVTFYTSSDGKRWAQLGAAITSAPTSIFNGTADVQIGKWSTNGEPMTGWVYRAQFYAGINGTLVGDSPPFTSTPVTDAQGNLWILHGTVLPATGVYPVETVKFYSSVDRILNTVIANKKGGNVQSVSDATSIRKYGTIASGQGYPKTDLICTSDGTVLSLAIAQLARSAYDENGIESFTLNVDMDPVGLPYPMVHTAHMGVDMRMAMSVQWHHPSGSSITKKVIVDGYTASVTAMDGNGSQLAFTMDIHTSTADPPTNSGQTQSFSI